MKHLTEYDYEPVPGLPTVLPDGEYLRWQGAPDWRELALRTFHVRKIAIYFGLLLTFRIVVQTSEGVALSQVLASSIPLAVLAGVAVGLLALLAWLAARVSLYTITNRRLVIRCGMTVPVTINLPFSRVLSADLRERPSRHGDILLTLEPGHSASWIMLWPHVRLWRWGSVQPMLRAIPDVQQAAELLAEALAEQAGANGQAVSVPRVVRDRVETSGSLNARGAV